jgi:predicted RNA-binding Zn ribbon-like protein
VPSPSAFLDWCLGTGVFDAGYVSELRARWEERPREALALYRRAVVLREAIYALFRSRILADGVPKDALRLINETLAALPPRARIAPAGNGFGWLVRSTHPTPSDLLAPIAWSAADLITSPRAHRVRQCEDAKGCDGSSWTRAGPAPAAGAPDG